MRFYEVTFILWQELQSQDIPSKIEHFTSIIEQNGGKIRKKEYWGLRTLAYKIRKKSKGHYVHLVLECSPEVISELERNFKISEEVIKFLSVRVDTINEEPSIMMQTPSNVKEKRG